MISAKDAATQAAKYLTDLVPGVNQVLVEEVSRIGTNYQITLSYASPNVSGAYLLMQGRDYKTFEINGGTGEVLSMKIRAGKTTE